MRRSFVFYDQDVKQVLASLFFDAVEIFSERYGDDVPFSDLKGRLHDDFKDILDELFEERMMEALIVDEVETLDPNVRKLADTIKETGAISPDFIEQISLITKNGLFIIETSE